MENRRIAALFAAFALATLALALPSAAKIERLTLPELVHKCDDAVLGRIERVEVQRLDHPGDGPDLFYTTLWIDGRSAKSGAAVRQAVTFAGGTLPDGTGAWNAEAPSADDIRVGNRVVAFHKWTDNMGGGLAAHALYAAHGGLYRVMETRKGEFVLGRGEGYALDRNRTLGELERELAELVK